MAFAFLRLFLVSAVVLILGFLAVFFIRSAGLQQGFAAPPSPWFLQDFWWVYSPDLDHLCREENLAQEWIYALPVSRGENEWLAACPTPVNLAEYLKKSPRKDWLLKIQAHETYAIDDLIKAIGEVEKDKHIAIWSESQKVSMYLRKKAPHWLFAADGASLVRFRMFESLWMETAFEFWPDFIVTSKNVKNYFHLDARGATELERRKKRVLWNWISDADGDPDIPIQGVMTNRPSEAQQRFGKRL